MLTTEEASSAIVAALPPLSTEDITLQQAIGRVLRQDVVAERDQPPFDRVTMDGIAIDYAALSNGRREFTIQATQHAGDAVQTLAGPDFCIETMTGAVLPLGCDCVIPVERLTATDDTVTVAADYAAKARQFVHPRGSDHRKGTRVLQQGSPLSPMDIAIAASCGLDRVRVSRLPAIRVVSTGNELVRAGAPIADHQIRMSNGPALETMFSGQGFNVVQHDHLPDDIEILETNLAQILNTTDVLVLSGGVSMGKADYVPQVLDKLGVELVFHKISQRPGKPMWFGMGPRQQAVFALPGNPVSSLVCARHYVLPALLAASCRNNGQPRFAALSEDVEFKPDLTCFLPVRVRNSGDAKTYAIPVPTNTSGDFAALGGTDGYVELRKEESVFAAGKVVPFHAWDAP